MELIKCVLNECQPSLNVTVGKLYLGEFCGNNTYLIKNDEGEAQHYFAYRFEKVPNDAVLVEYKGYTHELINIDGENNKLELRDCVSLKRDEAEIDECTFKLKGKRKGTKRECEPASKIQEAVVADNTGEVVYAVAEAPVELAEDYSALVNVLGTDYAVIFRSKEQDEHLVESLGYTDFYKKEIVIADDLLQYGATDDIARNALINDHTIRHEIVHAFFFESGLDGSSDYARNEELVDWLAIQIPKIVKVFNKMEVM